jgi:threonine/homoserine efflux transporter RhtA
MKNFTLLAVVLFFLLLIPAKMMMSDRTFDYLLYYGSGVSCLTFLVYLTLQRDAMMESNKNK